MKRCIYFKDEREFRLVRMFLDNLRLKEQMKDEGITEKDLEPGHDGRDFSNIKQNTTSAENKKEESIPHCCKKMIELGYDKDLVMKAYKKHSDMINNAGEGVVVYTPFEETIKGMLNG